MLHRPNQVVRLGCWLEESPHSRRFLLHLTWDQRDREKKGPAVFVNRRFPCPRLEVHPSRELKGVVNSVCKPQMNRRKSPRRISRRLARPQNSITDCGISGPVCRWDLLVYHLDPCHFRPIFRNRRGHLELFPSLHKQWTAQASRGCSACFLGLCLQPLVCTGPKPSRSHCHRTCGRCRVRRDHLEG